MHFKDKGGGKIFMKKMPTLPLPNTATCKFCSVCGQKLVVSRCTDNGYSTKTGRANHEFELACPQNETDSGHFAEYFTFSSEQEVLENKFLKFHNLKLQ